MTSEELVSEYNVAKAPSTASGLSQSSIYDAEELLRVAQDRLKKQVGAFLVSDSLNALNEMVILTGIQDPDMSILIDVLNLLVMKRKPVQPDGGDSESRSDRTALLVREIGRVLCENASTTAPVTLFESLCKAINERRERMLARSDCQCPSSEESKIEGTNALSCQWNGACCWHYRLTLERSP